MRGRHTLAAVCGVLCLLLALVSGVAVARAEAAAQGRRRVRRPPPSATPPVMPAAAKEKTKAGAIAFARHFVEPHQLRRRDW